MNTLYVAPVGSVAGPPLDWIETAARAWFPFPIGRLPTLQIPEDAYDAVREQYGSVELMKALARAVPADGIRLLGVTEADLGLPVLTFLFGQAQLNGPVALVSLCRLRQEFYGMPPDEELLRQRSIKEALHELGHTFGLTHCAQPACVMSLATHIGLVDSKGESYCGPCASRLERRVAASAEK